MGDAVQLLDTFARAAVAAYPALSLSIAYLNASTATTMHFAGDLVPQPDDSSIYEIGSITKTFTGTLLATAAANTDLALSTPVKELIPELEDSDFPENITLLSLATHTSGLPRLPSNLYPDDFYDLADAEACIDIPSCISLDPEQSEYILQPYAHYTADDLLEFLGNFSDPGNTFEYSNLGVGLLGYVLETSLGAPYDELLQEVITGPLGMHDTTCNLTPEQATRLVQGYIPKNADLAPEQVEATGLVELGDFYEIPAWEWTNAFQAAGCLRSTLADMITYAQASLDGANAVPASCASNAVMFPPPDPEACIPEAPSVEDVLGYAQQRQAVRGERITFPVGPIFSVLVPDIFGDGEVAPAPAPVSDFGYEIDYEYDYETAAPSNELAGVGLNWLTEDWSDAGALGGSHSNSSLNLNGLKYHGGGTWGSNSIILLHPELDAAIVLLSNFGGDPETGFSPMTVALRAVDAWWCEVAGGEC